MKKLDRWRASRQRFLFILLLVGLSFGFLMRTDFRANAQANDELWKEPINLSQSGAATEPRMVVDANGVIHVFWRENAVNRFFYTREERGKWREPVSLELPFATRRHSADLRAEDPTPLYDPLLIASANGRIHAFWLDEDRTLFTSNVLADEIENYSSWTGRQRLTESALDFNIVVDGVDGLHLSYIRGVDTPEAPVGIYYRRLAGGDQAWSASELLIEDAYFRSVDAAEANIQIATASIIGETATITDSTAITDTTGITNTVSVTGTAQIYPTNVILSWDRPLLEQLQLIKSPNGGQTWGSPQIVDERKPDDSTEAIGPSRVALTVVGDEEVHLAWLAGHESDCEQIHQWSNDGGQTWQNPVSIAVEGLECPTSFEFVTGNDDLMLLLNQFDSGVYLRAWNGTSWSDPERQSEMSNFVDPVTYRQVDLGCKQTAVANVNKLLVVGCSVSNFDDVWLLERPLGEESEWFPQESTTWSEPTALEATEDHLSDPLILSESNNLLHTFWIATESNNVTDTNADIYYTSWNGDTWSRQVPLLHLNTTMVDQLSGILDRDNSPFLLWRDQETNTYFYSAVKGEDILLPADWSVPQTFLEPEVLISHPAPFLDNNGLINVIYAIPLNEGRGIYLLRTADNGKTWLAPIPVVDAFAENWTMVDRPYLAQTENGDLHAVFNVYSLGPEPVAEALYYTRSDDDGETWSDVELVAEGDIRWSQVVGIDNQTVLIAWQEQDGDEVRLWSQQSTDGGVKWERPLLILDPDTAPASFSFITQLPDQPYLVQVQMDPDGELQLLERFWRDNTWHAIESHDLNIDLENENLLDLAAAVTGNGRLMTIFNTESALLVEQLQGNQQLNDTQLASDKPLSSLFFTYRSINVPAGNASTGITLVTTPTPPIPSTPTETLITTEMPKPTASAEPAPTENPDGARFEVEQADGSDQSTSPTARLMMGLVPVTLLIAVLLAVGIRKSLSKH